MFPTAGSTIYRNDEGEVTGWDTPYYDAPEDEGDWYDRDDYYDEDVDPETCDHRDFTHPSPNGEPARCDLCGIDAVEWIETEEVYTDGSPVFWPVWS